MVRDRRLYATVIRQFLGPIAEILFGLVLFVALMLPIIFLWIRNKHMDVSYKSTLTVIFFLFSAGLLIPALKAPFLALFSNVSYSNENQILRRFRHLHFTRSNSPINDGSEHTQSISRERSRSSNSRRTSKDGILRRLAHRLMGRRLRGQGSESIDRPSRNSSLYADSDASPERTRISRGRGPSPRRTERVRIRSSERINRWQDEIHVNDPNDLVEVIEESNEHLPVRDHDQDDLVGLDPAMVPLPPSTESFELRTMTASTGTSHNASFNGSTTVVPRNAPDDEASEGNSLLMEPRLSLTST